MAIQKGRLPCTGLVLAAIDSACTLCQALCYVLHVSGFQLGPVLTLVGAGGADIGQCLETFFVTTAEWWALQASSGRRSGMLLNAP